MIKHLIISQLIIFLPYKIYFDFYSEVQREKYRERSGTVYAK